MDARIIVVMTCLVALYMYSRTSSDASPTARCEKPYRYDKETRSCVYDASLNGKDDVNPLEKFSQDATRPYCYYDNSQQGQYYMGGKKLDESNTPLTFPDTQVRIDDFCSLKASKFNDTVIELRYDAVKWDKKLFKKSGHMESEVSQCPMKVHKKFTCILPGMTDAEKREMSERERLRELEEERQRKRDSERALEEQRAKERKRALDEQISDINNKLQQKLGGMYSDELARQKERLIEEAERFAEEEQQRLAKERREKEERLARERQQQRRRDEANRARREREAREQAEDAQKKREDREEREQRRREAERRKQEQRNERDRRRAEKRAQEAAEAAERRRSADEEYNKMYHEQEARKGRERATVEDTRLNSEIALRNSCSLQHDVVTYESPEFFARVAAPKTRFGSRYTAVVDSANKVCESGWYSKVIWNRPRGSECNVAKHGWYNLFPKKLPQMNDTFTGTCGDIIATCPVVNTADSACVDYERAKCITDGSARACKTCRNGFFVDKDGRCVREQWHHRILRILGWQDTRAFDKACPVFGLPGMNLKEIMERMDGQQQVGIGKILQHVTKQLMTQMFQALAGLLSLGPTRYFAMIPFVEMVKATEYFGMDINTLLPESALTFMIEQLPSGMGTQFAAKKAVNAFLTQGPSVGAVMLETAASTLILFDGKKQTIKEVRRILSALISCTVQKVSSDAQVGVDVSDVGGCDWDDIFTSKFLDDFMQLLSEKSGTEGAIFWKHLFIEMSTVTRMFEIKQAYSEYAAKSPGVNEMDTLEKFLESDYKQSRRKLVDIWKAFCSDTSQTDVLIESLLESAPSMLPKWRGLTENTFSLKTIGMLVDVDDMLDRSKIPHMFSSPIKKLWAFFTG